jgi:hypothetical protein
LRLFDALQPLRRMGHAERIWLRAVALLPDVGNAELFAGVFDKKIVISVAVVRRSSEFGLDPAWGWAYAKAVWSRSSQSAR